MSTWLQSDRGADQRAPDPGRSFQMPSLGTARHAVSRLLKDYGMFLVLLLLCGYYSWATLSKLSALRKFGQR